MPIFRRRKRIADYFPPSSKPKRLSAESKFWIALLISICLILTCSYYAVLLSYWPGG